MDQRASIRYNVTGQTVEFYPPQWRFGAPSSAAAYSVWKGEEDNDQDAVFSGTATASTVSTTVDQASGYSQSDRRLLYLAATTSINEGETYLVEDGEGRTELVRVAGISSGSHVILEKELSLDYESGDTFVGLRQVFTVDATWVADDTNINDPLKNPYRIRWRYTIDSVAYEHWTYMDLVEVAKQHNVTAADLYEVWPDLENQEPFGIRGQGWRDTIDAAFDRLTAEMRTERISMDALRDAQLLDELLRMKTLTMIAEVGIVPNNRDPEGYVSDMQIQYSKMKRGAIAVINEDKAGGGSITQDKPIQVKLRR
jgi:hypothetical protein